MEESKLLLDAVILSADGKRKIQDSIAGAPEAAAELGRMLAGSMYDAGGREILAELLAEACDKGEE